MGDSMGFRQRDVIIRELEKGPRVVIQLVVALCMPISMTSKRSVQKILNTMRKEKKVECIWVKKTNNPCKHCMGTGSD